MGSHIGLMIQYSVRVVTVCVRMLSVTLGKGGHLL